MAQPRPHLAIALAVKRAREHLPDRLDEVGDGHRPTGPAAAAGGRRPRRPAATVDAGPGDAPDPANPGALAFRATIDDPHRFATSRAAGAHLGVTPARHQSGETDIKGRISRCGDEFARTALYEAGHTLLVRSTKWSSLRAWGMEVARRRSMARARVAVARKLGVILHRMWRDGADFRFGKAPTAAAA